MGNEAQWVKDKVLGQYSPEERSEYEQLVARRAELTASEEQRLQELLDLPLNRMREKHDALTPENDLSLYAEEIGERMRAREASGSSARNQGSSSA